MNGEVIIQPGRTLLADWREIHDGAAVGLDPFARADVEAGRAALATILSQNGLLPPLDSGNGPSVAEMIEARGEILPEGHLRLFMGLKIAALAQGVSGVRWEVVEALAELLARDLLPVVPIGSSDRLGLSHLYAALTGAGEILFGGRIRPATDLLRDADLRPLSPNPRERSALLSGNTLTLASTLAALFATERVLQSVVIATALFALSNGHTNAALPLSVHRLHRQRGQLDVATALHALAPLEEAEVDHAHDDAGAADHSVVFRTGAALDLLRQAAVILERAANSASEDRLVLWQSEELIYGTEDRTSLAHAADLMALSLVTLGALAAERISNSHGSGTNGTAPDVTDRLAKAHDQAGTPSLSVAGIERISGLLETISEIVAIDLLLARRRGIFVEGALSEVMGRVRDAAPLASEAGAFADKDVAAVARLVRAGTLAAPRAPLPSLASAPPFSVTAR